MQPERRSGGQNRRRAVLDRPPSLHLNNPAFGFGTTRKTFVARCHDHFDTMSHTVSRYPQHHQIPVTAEPTHSSVQTWGVCPNCSFVSYMDSDGYRQTHEQSSKVYSQRHSWGLRDLASLILMKLMGIVVGTIFCVFDLLVWEPVMFLSSFPYRGFRFEDSTRTCPRCGDNWRIPPLKERPIDGACVKCGYGKLSVGLCRWATLATILVAVTLLVIHIL